MQYTYEEGDILRDFIDPKVDAVLAKKYSETIAKPFTPEEYQAIRDFKNGIGKPLTPEQIARAWKRNIQRLHKTRPGIREHGYGNYQFKYKRISVESWGEQGWYVCWLDGSRFCGKIKDTWQEAMDYANNSVCK